MKIKKILFALVIIQTCNLHLISQQLFQTVKGTVIEAETQIPLPGATVLVVASNTQLAANTNTEGLFKLQVPVGRVDLHITYLGYEEVFVSNVQVVSGKETVIQVEMREKIIKAEEVVIKGSKNKEKPINTMASVSARMLTTEDASRYAGGFNDPSRMVSSFAGVATVEGDGVNDIVIRGNSPRGLTWRLEGTEIPNPNHFSDGQGATGGAVGIITSSVLSNSDFFTSAFPAEFGNAYSGIMDLNLRKGNTDKPEYAFQLGVIGIEASAEGPINKQSGSSYLLSYRYSSLALLADAKLYDPGDNDLAPKFQDLNYHFVFPTKNWGTFSLFGLGGYSTTGTTNNKDSSEWIGDFGRMDETETHAMTVTGLKHMYLLKNRSTYIKTILSGSILHDSWDRGYLLDNLSRQEGYYDKFTYPSTRVSSMLNHKWNNRHTTRLGAIYSILSFDAFAREYDWANKKSDILVDQSGKSSQFQSYFQWKYRIAEKLELNTGLHYLYYDINKKYSLEPRTGIQWQLNSKNSLSFGLGLHSKTELPFVYFVNIPDQNGNKSMVNRNLGMTKAIHYVIGYDVSVYDNFRIKSEVYYQSLFDVPVVDESNSFLSALNFNTGIPDRKLTNEGLGKNYGIELTIEKFYSQGYYFLITNSLFESKYKALDKKWHNTIFNSNYVTNFLFGKDFKTGKTKQDTWGFNLKGFTRGGFRYTPFDIENSRIQGEEIINMEKIFQNKLPAFTRLDLGLKYQKNFLKYSWAASIDIQNILNRPNVIGKYYDDDLKDVNKIVGNGLIPIINFRVEF